MKLLCFWGGIHHVSGVISFGLSVYPLILHRNWIVKKVGEQKLFKS